MTKKDLYGVKADRRMNDDYSVELPLKKKLAKGFASVASDYAVGKWIQGKRH